MCKCKIILHEFHTLTLTPFPTNLYIYKTCMMQQIHTFVCQVEGKMVDGFFFCNDLYNGNKHKNRNYNKFTLLKFLDWSLPVGCTGNSADGTLLSNMLFVAKGNNPNRKMKIKKRN